MRRRKKAVNRNPFVSAPSCHFGPVEVIKNLFCGSEDEALAMASAPIRVDTLIPLYSLDAAIWDTGFRGEVLYYPIKDYETLPNDVLDSLVLKILDRLDGNKKVGVFCMGGHGRTGYVAAAVLGKRGYKDPIGFLRANYCRQAVESDEQIRHISDFLGKPELAESYEENHELICRSALEALERFGMDSYGRRDFGSDCPATCPVCGSTLLPFGYCPNCGEEWRD